MSRTKVDIVSGFLGAGKTTFIRKLLEDAIQGEQVVLIENEFGEIGIDGGFLKDAGIEIKEMNSGCICCSLAGDFAASLKEILSRYSPDRIIIEPSGVGKLSDVLRAVAGVEEELEVEKNSAVAVVDAKKAKLYSRNFGEFFNNQIQFASTIVLSRTDICDQEKIDEAVAVVRMINPDASVITTPIALLSGASLLEILESPVDLKKEMLEELDEEDDECEDPECECHHHHHHEDEEEHEHHHHHHHDGDDHDEEEHEHHHHHHHHHHHADEVFDSWGLENIRGMAEEDLKAVLDRLASGEEYGKVVRCKGMIPSEVETEWLYFDLVPGEVSIRRGEPYAIGKVCVIGSELKEDALKSIFRR